MKYKSLTPLILTACWLGLHPGLPVGLAQEPPPNQPVGRDLVDAARLLDGVRWLADDAREGRMTGSPGEHASAQWIAARFREAGLEPGGDAGSFLQEYTATVGARLGADNTIQVMGVPGLDALTVGRDFNPFGFSESGVAEGEILFVGYGITAKDLSYDDYAGLDVTGKIVLVLRHEPQQNDAKSVFNGKDWSNHALYRTKATNARDHGAVGLLVFTGPLSEGYAEDELTTLSGAEGIGGGNLLAAHVKKEVGEALLRQAGIDLRAWVDSVDVDLKPRSRALGSSVRARLALAVEKDRKNTANVVGIRRGLDPAAGAVIIGAHYDHLGRGNSSSLAPDRIGEIHNGADDNASGTAAVVELALVFARSEPVRRTLIFAAFSGEEIGLLGSSYLAGHPPVPLDQVQTMVNMDMVGRPRDGKITVGGVGSSPFFAELVREADEGSPLTLSTSRSGFGASDHTSFYAKKVPVLFFFNGLHEDYHRPTDDADKIDGPGLAEVTRVVFDVVRELADREARVEFTMAPEDTAGTPGTVGPPGRGYGPYFGSIPDMADYEGGVKLTGVREGSPAQKAGVLGGDIIVGFGEREIKDLYGYTAALRERAPGDTVQVVVLREGNRLTLSAVLGRRN